jgi:hypothetical protein
VVDELKVEKVAKAIDSKPAKLYRPEAKQAVEESPAIAEADQSATDQAMAATEATPADGFDFAQALASPSEDADREAQVAIAPVAPLVVTNPHVQEVVPGIVQPAAAYEGTDSSEPLPMPVSPAEPTIDDEALTDLVVRAIGRAKSEGHLVNFGIDVNSFDGMIQLEGTAASAQQRDFLGNIARHAPGARGVRNLIEIQERSATPAQAVSHRTPVAQPTPAPQPTSTLQPLPQGNQRRMAAMPPQRAPQPMQQRRPLAARPAAYGQAYGGQQIINGEQVVPGSMMTAGGGANGMPMGGQIAGAPMMGTPVPMAPAAPAGAPRYDSPNLPNYAWPGYAAHPNYAALSYPQQYSPAAFPYIGPFYPYPQVPLGWRKVSLEWDDGWWFLDFTDK